MGQSILVKDVVQCLLEYGAYVNASDKNGDTALHIAVSYNTTDLARLLLEYGAHINRFQLLQGDTT